MNNAPLFEKVLVAVAASLLFAGCYTQTGSEREESADPSYGSIDSRPGYDTSAADSGSYNDESYEASRRHFYYYDSYYPSVAIGVGFYDAWWYGYYPWYGPAYWAYPAYGWGYYGGYYPYHPYYGYGYPGYYSPYYGTTYATRTFGATRTGGTTRGGYPAYRGGSTATTPMGLRTATRGTGRTAGTQVTAGRGPGRTTHVAPGYRVPNSRRTVDGGYARGGSRGNYPHSRLSSPPSSSGSRSGRAYAPAPSYGNRGGGSAPSGGGGRGSASGGGRGGSRR